MKSIHTLLLLLIICTSLSAQTRTHRKHRVAQSPPSKMSAATKREIDDFIDEISVDWRLVTTANSSVFFYGTGTKRRTADDTMQVWIKEVPNPAIQNNPTDFRFERTEERRKLNLSLEGFDKYDRSMMLYECNCFEGKIRMLSFVDYNDTGQVLDTSDSPLQWQHVVPDSLGSGVLTAACRGFDYVKRKHN
jgi:hypothetical protein